MKVISVNVSLPKQVRWRGESISTGIFKEPVSHRVGIGPLQMEGDQQADLTVHGGPDKAIYGYAAEHYTHWKEELDGRELPWGIFGENLTIEGGLFENDVFVGDRFLIGTAEVMAIQPRLPCYKLGIRFGTQRMLKRFAESGRYGIYFRVLKEGTVQVNDQALRLARSEYRVSIGDVARLLLGYTHDRALVEAGASVEFLPVRLRAHFQSLLERGQENTAM